MVLRPFTRHSFKHSAVCIVAVNACCQELLVIEINIKVPVLWKLRSESRSVFVS